MSKKPLSEMSAQDFLTAMGALGLNVKTLAHRLGKSAPTVSRYCTGSMPIPVDVVQNLGHLIVERRAELSRIYTGAIDSVQDMLVATNTVKPPAPRTDRRLAHRGAEPNTSTFPAYRIQPRRITTYIRALEAWTGFVSERVKSPATQKELASMNLELADLKSLLSFARGCAQQGGPYDIVITKSEWHVVSRALRHLYTQHEDPNAFAMYQHWRRHKGSGYPRA